jgi:hypothetical protein
VREERQMTGITTLTGDSFDEAIRAAPIIDGMAATYGGQGSSE